MLKLTPALLIVYLLLRRRWEAAAAAVVLLAALAATCTVIVGPGVTLASLGQALSVGTGDAGLGHNEALFAPLLTALGASPIIGLARLGARTVTIGLALALGYWLWRGPPAGVVRQEDREHAESAGYAIALCAMLLLSPTAWVHHYIWVLPAAAIALGSALRCALTSTVAVSSARAWTALALVVLACVALGWSLPDGWDTTPQPAVTTYVGLPLWPLLLELRPFGALALAGVLAWWYAQPVGTRASSTTSERA
jgi:alpha-1,2-mannosyltransferase